MIRLTQASSDAFRRREVRITPVLEVEDERGGATRVSPSLLISRPTREISPVLNRSPVVRLTVEVAPTPEMADLFREGRRITYAEIVNGQPFAYFAGRIGPVKRDWTIEGGRTEIAMVITAWSPSQQLASSTMTLRHYTRNKTAPAATEKLLATAIALRTTAYVTRAAAGNDALPMNAVLRPHSVDAAAVARWGAPGAETTATGGVEFTIAVGASGQLEVVWASGAPAAGTSYALEYTAPIQFVFERPHFYAGGGTPAGEVMRIYELEPGAAIAVEAIDADELDYERYFSPSGTLLRVWVEVSEGGAFTEADLTDYEFTLERGYFRYVGKGAIFDTTDPGNAGHVTMIGVAGLAWPDTESEVNDTNHLLKGIINRGGGVAGAIAPTSVVLAEAVWAGSGAEVLAAVYGGLAPNYTLLDDPTGSTGAQYLIQEPTPTFSLRAVRALRTREVPEVYTRVVVETPLSDQVLDLSGYVTNGGDDYRGAFISGEDAYATIDGGQTYLRFAIPFDAGRRLEGGSVTFDGELRGYLVDATVAGEPDYATARHLLPVAQHKAPGTVSLPADWAVHFPTDGAEVRYLVLELHPSAAIAAPKLYHLEVTATLVQRAIAMVAAYGPPTTGEWTPIAGPGVAAGLGFWRYAPLEFVARFLLDPRPARDPHTYAAEYWKHRTKTLTVPGISRARGNGLARAYLDDILRRASAQEVDVLVDPRVEVGDTVSLHDLATGEQENRLVIGLRDGSSWTEPITTLELADYR